AAFEPDVVADWHGRAVRGVRATIGGLLAARAQLDPSQRGVHEQRSENIRADARARDRGVSAAFAARPAEQERVDLLLAARRITGEPEAPLAQGAAHLGQDLGGIRRAPGGGDANARVPRISGVEVHLARLDDEGFPRYLDATARRELEIAAHLDLFGEADARRAREREIEIGARELHVAPEREREQP